MVDEDVVVDRLRHINQYTEDLKQMRGMSKEEYVHDMITQRAVERTFMNLIQSCIDLAQHIRSTENLSPSGTSKKEIEALGNAETISNETQEKMEEAVGFRNILRPPIRRRQSRCRLRRAAYRSPLVRTVPNGSRSVVPAVRIVTEGFESPPFERGIRHSGAIAGCSSDGLQRHRRRQYTAAL